MYFSISKDEQEKRFKEIINSPLKRWKYSDVDRNALKLWDKYTEYKEKMFDKTDTEFATWEVFKANRKPKARIESLEYILQNIPYQIKNDEILKHENID
jgi:polyphosphate kinase 2 (PPK2 family)